ncbi:glycosyltransferase [Variovorax soli]|uniref:glycosyltransferase n=1 Tax=Variovorax soli TaxID=376815 RepID=UPI0013796DB8|nr:glycosyltransferase [Variovorax soli]
MKRNDECLTRTETAHEIEPYDVFVDLSQWDGGADALLRHAEFLLTGCGHGAAAGAVFIVPPPHVKIGSEAEIWLTGVTPAAALSRAVLHAATHRRHLLVLLGSVLPPNESVMELVRVFRRDPHFGSAQPRFASSLDDSICPFPTKAGRSIAAGFTSRAALPHLPQVSILPELVAACQLLRREVVEAWSWTCDASAAGAALTFGLVQARRRGFRCIALNHATVSLPVAPAKAEIGLLHDWKLAYPPLSNEEYFAIIDKYPDHAIAEWGLDDRFERRLEAVWSAAYPHGGESRRLLIDCRGLSPIHNGTSECVLGLLDGLRQLATKWKVDIQSDLNAAEFHSLTTRYPEFAHVHGDVRSNYAAAFVPNQPWGMQRIAELHNHAAVIVFNMLDTIGWDIVYSAPHDIGRTWRSMARHSDGIAYISAYSRDRFRTRFQVGREVSERVIHLSLAAEDYVRLASADRTSVSEDYVLLFGNSYDHKDVDRTLALLLDAFPLQDFVVLGGRDNPNSRVKVVPSGSLPEMEIHLLVAASRAIVYPSFYEGFGLPVVQALSYGKPVIVRRSELWQELIARSNLPGRLHEFEDTVSLVRALGSVLEAPAAEREVDARENGDENGWRRCAAESIAFVEQCLRRITVEKWRERDDALGVAHS